MRRAGGALGGLAGLWALLLVTGLLAGPAAAQTVESSVSAFLTAEITWPDVRGDRRQRFRVGTKDLTLALLEELETQGDLVSLVVQRPIEDLSSPAGVHLLRVDGLEHDVSAWIQPAENGLPPGYFASARRSVRDAHARELSFVDEGTEVVELGEVETRGFTLTLVGTAQRTARLLSADGQDLGYAFRSVRGSVIGGLASSFRYRDGVIGGVALVTGRLVRGPERLVEP